MFFLKEILVLSVISSKLRGSTKKSKPSGVSRLQWSYVCIVGILGIFDLLIFYANGELMNVYKHSHAQQVEIQIAEMREDASYTIRLSIADNGQGFEVSQIPTGFGLRGIRERSESVGGRLSIMSKPHQGCRIRMTIPMMQEAGG
jgi:hypothetical protein